PHREPLALVQLEVLLEPHVELVARRELPRANRFHVQRDVRNRLARDAPNARELGASARKSNVARPVIAAAALEVDRRQDIEREPVDARDLTARLPAGFF